MLADLPVKSSIFVKSSTNNVSMFLTVILQSLHVAVRTLVDYFLNFTPGLMSSSSGTVHKLPILSSYY